MGCKAFVVGSEFCGDGMADLNFRRRLGLTSVLEEADKNGVVFEVTLLEFHLVWVQMIDRRVDRGNFSIDVALAERE